MTATATNRSFLDAARDEVESEGEGRSFIDAARDVERGAALLRKFGVGDRAPEARPEPTLPIPGLDQPIAPGGPTWRGAVAAGYPATLERGPTATERGRAIERRRAGRQEEAQRKAGWLDRPPPAPEKRTAEDIRLGRAPIAVEELTPAEAKHLREMGRDQITRPSVSWLIGIAEALGRWQGVKPEAVAPPVEKWAEMGPITAGEMNRRTEFDQVFGVGSLARLAQLRAATERLKQAEGKGYDIREADLREVEDYLLRHYEVRARGTTLGADVVPGLKAMPAWMIEFMATGGWAALGRGAARAGAKKLIGRAVKGKVGGLVGWVGSGAMRTVAMPHRVGAEYFDQLLGDYELSDEGKVIVLQAGAKPATAFLNAIVNTMIEVMSEEAGEALVRGGVRVLKALPGGARMARLARRLQVAAPKAAWARFVQTGFSKAGYSSLIGEMGEEQLARMMRAVTGTGKEHRGMGLFKRFAESIPSGRELLVEGLTLAVPGAVKAGVVRLAGAREAPPPPPAEPMRIEPRPEPAPAAPARTFLEAAKVEAPKVEPVKVEPEPVTPAPTPAAPEVKAVEVAKPEVKPTPAKKPAAKEPAKRIISEESYKEAIKHLSDPKVRGGLVPFSGEDIKAAGTVILYHIESGLRKMGEIWEQVKEQMDAKLFRQAWRATGEGRARLLKIQAVARAAERKGKVSVGRKAKTIAVAEGRMTPAEREKLTASIKAGIRGFKTGQKELSEVQSAMTSLVQGALPQSQHDRFAQQIAAADTPNRLNLLSGRILNAIRKEQIKAGAEQQAIEAVSPEIITTPSKLLAYAMKKAQTVSRQAHLAATRDMALSHTELAKLAEATLPKSEQGKVLPMIAKARTPAEMRRVAMSISMLGEHHEQRTALADFKQATKGIRKQARKGRIRPEYQAKIDALLDSIDPKRHAQHTLNAAERLMKMLEVESDPNIPQSVINRARNLSEAERRTPLYKLAPETIRGITAALQQIVHLSNTKNRIYFGRRAKAAQEVIDNSIAEVELNNPKVKTQTMAEERRMSGALWLTTRGQLSVDTTAFELGDETGDVYRTLVTNPLEGNNQFLEFQASAAEALAKVFAAQGMTAKDLQRWSASVGRAGLIKRAGRALFRKQGVEYVKTALPKAMTAGARLREIELTRAQRVTLWCHLHDSGTRRELLRHAVEGIYLPGYHTRAIKLHPADIAALEESFTPQEEAIGQAMMDWLNGPCRAGINKAFLSNEGHEIARRTDYFPRRRYGDAEGVEPDKILAYWRDSMLNQQGIFKERVGSKKAIVVGDAFEVFYAHANRTAAYIGKHAAVLDALRLLRNPDFRHTVKSRFKYGGSILFDLEKAIKEYRGLEVQADAKFERWLRGITSRAHVGILGYSPHISLYQVVSYMYAGIEMDARDLGKVWNFRLPTKRLIAEISAHSPSLKARFRGTGHQILTPSAARYSMTEFYFGQEPGWRSKAMVTIRKMDQLAIGNIYQAAKSEGQRKGFSGEALMAYAAKRAETVTNRTQPTWDLITTSALSVEARKSLIARLATLFSSQRAKIVNMAYRSWVRFRRSPHGAGDYARFAKTLSLIGFGASAVYWIARFSWRGILGPPDERNKRTIADHLWGMTERLLGSWVVVGDAAAEAMRLTRMRIKGRPSIFLEPRPNLLYQGFADATMSLVEFSGAIAERMRDEDAKSAKSAMRAVDHLIRALTILGGVPIRVAWAAARARLKKTGSAIKGRRTRRTRRSRR